MKFKWRPLILVTCFLVITILGGIILHYLEAPAERKIRNGASVYLDNFLNKHKCLPREDLEDLIRKVLRAYDRSIHPLNNVNETLNWDIPNSIFFAGTIGTTVGYGNIFPETTGGKVFIIFFAFVAIPVTFAMLDALGRVLRDACAWVDVRLFAKSNCNKKCHPKCSFMLKHVHPILFLGILLFLLIPAAIFMVLENWTYGEALYYCIISVTTIGLGDYVVANNTEQPAKSVYLLCCWLWIILGMVWLSTVLHVHMDVYEEVVDRMEKKAEEGERKLGDKIQEMREKRKESSASVSQLEENGKAHQNTEADVDVVDIQ